LKKVEDLLRAAKHRNEIATTIGVLEVFIKAGDDKRPFKLIQELFHRTVNVTDLVLRSSKPNRIISTMTFTSLASLDINISHRLVRRLIQMHPRIDDLTLGACLTVAVCPLADCSLRSLRSLTCPPSCVRAITDGVGSAPVTRLITTYRDVGRRSFPILQLLNFHPLHISGILTTLHIDYDHTANNLLLRICAAAPALMVLKLTESKFSEVRHLIAHACSCLKVHSTVLWYANAMV
jgi:hypothetical protein